MPRKRSLIMTTFNDRKDAFESKFAHDAEMQFKA
ncbi:MAG: ATPase inhibitor subunit zeta, partial [Pseudomonadota bacterium]